MSEVATGQRIARKFCAHFINTAAPGAAAAAYSRLGADLEEYKEERNANVEKKRNILGQNRVSVTSYEKSAGIDPYYAVVGDPLFERLQAIVDNDLVLDDCNTDVVTVKLWENPTAGAYPAIREKGVIEVSSSGGDNTGYQIPFNVHLTGEKTAGSFNPETKTFTPTAVAGE